MVANVLYVIVSIQTQDSPVHYVICCSLGLVTMYGAPELWLCGALENAILIDSSFSEKDLVGLC